MIEYLWIGGFTFMLMGALFANGMVWFEKTPKDERKIWQWAYFIFFIVLDVLWNWIFATVLFLQVPREFTLSERLRNILRYDETSWRPRLAFFICKRFIEPHDQGHCGLAYTRYENERSD